MESISKILESDWIDGKNDDDGSPSGYQVAETVHSLV